MNLHNLSKEHLQLIIDSVNTNPSIEAHIREEILKPIKLQFEEQLKGGAWKRRIREQGHVI